jgi:putative methyltransferase (TIGR04325 family)
MAGAIRSLLPPVLLPMLRRLRGRSIRYVGNFGSWKEAQARSDGYDSATILDRVTDATRRVLAGNASFERDSICFDIPDYRWPLVASLLWVAAQNRGKLDVVDFGGSLASTYLQNRQFLAGLEQVRWSVLEQPAFVRRGEELFPRGLPEFRSRVEDCSHKGSRQLLLLSSVLQYLSRPYEVLAYLQMHQFPYVIVDRTPVVPKSASDRLTVQIVPSSIYPASYPCWFLSLDRLMQHFLPAYRIVAELPCDEKTTVGGIEYRGFLFERESTEPGR